MAVETSFFHNFRFPRRGSHYLIAATLVLAVACGGAVYAANNSVQGAKKDDHAFDGDAPTAILIEGSSGSVLFEKNADELRAPSSMMKLMTAEVVFNAIKKGDVKLTDQYRISENAWSKGGAPSGGSTVQNDTRLIVVVNGLEDPDDRAQEAKKMLEWGFRNFEARTLFAANQQVGYAKVFGGESRSVKLAGREPIKVMVAKNGAEKLIARIVYNGPVRAPVQAGQPVGVVKVWRGANIAVETPVYAA